MEAQVDVDRVLVPVDGSDESTEAAKFAIAIAERYEANLRAVYVVDEQVVRGIDTGTLEKAEVASEAESYLDSIADMADSSGVPLSTATAYGYSTRRKAQHPGSVVLDHAEETDADFIVVPREPQSGGSDEVLAKAAEYVLLYASQPILSV